MQNEMKPSKPTHNKLDSYNQHQAKELRHKTVFCNSESDLGSTLMN